MKPITTRTPRSFIESWQEHHGEADPRIMLDSFFWNTRTGRYSANKDMEEWCNQNLGDENWYRMFDKFWFTSESDYVMFTLTWNGEK